MESQLFQNRVQEFIRKRLIAKLQLAYFAVDEQMNVRDASPNLSDYGFPILNIGKPVGEQIDFMIGMDANTELDLPVVSSPSGIPVSVSLMPDNDQLTVLISNASTATEQRQLLQQAANENELLVEEQKRLMAELEVASQELEEKNRLLEEASRLQTSFISGVSHEFRTPLTSIIGYTNLVKTDLAKMSEEIVPRITKQDSSDYLNAVQRSSKHLLSLVENLLDHGKLDSDEINIRPKPTDLFELFNDVEVLLAPLSTTKNIDLIIDLKAPDGVHVVLDDSRLRQCLVNLVGNAIKFTDIGHVRVNATLENEVLNVEVLDTGLGIAPEDLEKIRLPFYQAADTGKVGTGLGLTITERIIDMMGGQLDIESELGGGTQVCFSMPAPIVDLVAVAEVEANIESGELRVLLAEDDSDIADLVVMMLSEQGMNVTRVPNGALAVESISNHHYDIVLMDIHMPIMTGYEAIEVLNEQGCDTPIVVMSASAIESDQQRAMELGCAAYLVKPVDVHEIISIAQTIVEQENG